MFESTHRRLHVHNDDDAVTGVELDSLKEFIDIRFGEDKRLAEIARMLRSSVVTPVRALDRPDFK